MRYAAEWKNTRYMFAGSIPMTDEAAGIIQVIGRATSWWEWILTTILDGSVA